MGAGAVRAAVLANKIGEAVGIAASARIGTSDVSLFDQKVVACGVSVEETLGRIGCGLGRSFGWVLVYAKGHKATFDSALR